MQCGQHNTKQLSSLRAARPTSSSSSTDRVQILRDGDTEDNPPNWHKITSQHSLQPSFDSNRGEGAMSGTKALLKAINEAIKQQKWDEAITAAEDVFQKDPKNYHA